LRQKKASSSSPSPAEQKKLVSRNSSIITFATSEPAGKRALRKPAGALIVEGPMEMERVDMRPSDLTACSGRSGRAFYGALTT